MAETSFIYWPFKYYYNSFTDRYHLLQYTGKTPDGNAYYVHVIGRYETAAAAMAMLDRMREKERNTKYE